MFSLFRLVTCSLFFAESLVATQPQTCWQGATCSGPAQAAFSGKWDQYIFSPTSRTVSPASVLSADDSFISNYKPGASTLDSVGAELIFDFGQEVAGVVTVTYSAVGNGTLGLAFSEAKNFTGTNSDSSNGNFHTDGALYANVTTTQESSYTMPIDRLRGGFRYLTLFVDDVVTDPSTFTILIKDITLDIAYQPTWGNLQAYQGYFYSSDDLLNKIWYSGAFTLQTNAIPADTGRELLGSGWENDVDLDLDSTYPTIYVDGSKRDRTVWAGDLGIAVPSILLSTGDIGGAMNTIQVLYNNQLPTGELPFAGPGLNIYGSDTYHMATMIGTYDYYLFTGDNTFLSANWARYQLAMSFITAKIDSTGLLYVTGTNDWGRLEQGGHNSEANMLMYKVLTSGSSLATWMNNASLSDSWLATAATLKAAVNSASNNWDPSVGAYKDSDVDGSIHPQDANSMALFFGVADPSYISSISTELTTNWCPYGSVAPELPYNLIGFGQSWEIKGHIVAGQATRGLDLIRTAWGWYLNNAYGTASTCIEGYLANGTFGYRYNEGYGNDFSYTSHAHGWSTGPVDALTTYIVGLQLTGPGGSTWTLAPQFGDLTSAEAGFTTPLGKFQASWTVNNGGYDLSWNVPSGTSGTLVLPASSSGCTVQIDGQDVQTQGLYDGTSQTITISGSAGSHSATVVCG